MQLLPSGIAQNLDPRKLRSTAVVIPADKRKKRNYCLFLLRIQQLEN